MIDDRGMPVRPCFETRRFWQGSSDQPLGETAAILAVLLREGKLGVGRGEMRRMRKWMRGVVA